MALVFFPTVEDALLSAVDDTLLSAADDALLFAADETFLCPRQITEDTRSRILRRWSSYFGALNQDNVVHDVLDHERKLAISGFSVVVSVCQSSISFILPVLMDLFSRPTIVCEMSFLFAPIALRVPLVRLGVLALALAFSGFLFLCPCLCSDLCPCACLCLSPFLWDGCCSRCSPPPTDLLRNFVHQSHPLPTFCWCSCTLGWLPSNYRGLTSRLSRSFMDASLMKMLIYTWKVKNIFDVIFQILLRIWR